VHDQVDDILASMPGGAKVATIWDEGPLTDAAWDFLNLDFIENVAPSRIVGAFADDLESQITLLGELILACRKEIE
jgi:hypothetical protein